MDAVETDREQLILMKTTADRVPALEARLREIHSYELPQFIVLPASGGSAAYIDWVRDAVR